VRRHGTRVMYAFGPKGSDSRDGCRCLPCTDANRDYARWRASDDPAKPSIVDAAEARGHLRWLARRGVGLRAVHAASGVNRSTLQRILNGRQRIHGRTAERILLVLPVDAADRSLVDAAPTWRLIEDLLAHGWTKTAIARALGYRGRGLQLGRDKVTAANARKVRELHERVMLSVLVDRHNKASERRRYREKAA
jgi:hypothetical protein